MATAISGHRYEVQVFVREGDVIKGPHIFTTTGTLDNDKGIVGVIIGNVAHVGELVFLRVRDGKSVHDTKLCREITTQVDMDLDFRALVKTGDTDTQANNAKIARSFLSSGQKCYFVEKV